MGKATKYYLIGRDRETNEFDVIKVNGKRSNSLEDIDLYTTSFNDAKSFTNSLGKTGDIDYFIVNQSKRGKEVSIKKNEVLYDNSSKIRDIAYNSKNKHIEYSRDDVMALISLCCRKMGYDSSYYRMVFEGRTNIYDKFVSYFKLSKYRTANELSVRDGGWITKSYHLVRNIVDSFINDHTSKKHLNDEMYRNILDNRIKQVTDKDYDENQLTLFDMFPEERKDNTDVLLEVMTTIDTITMDEIEDKDFVETLPGSIKENVVKLVRNKHYYEVSPNSFIEEYRRKLIKAQTGIVKQLSEQETLDSTYNWCMLYNKYKEKISGDVNGYSYTKENRK